MKNNLMDYYESNLALLKEHHPASHEIILKQSSNPKGEIFRSSEGKFNIKVESNDGKMVNLHDLADPEAEVPQFLNMVPEDSTGFISLLGMGLGYTAAALLKKRSGIRHLVVFELDPEIFLQAMHCMDFSEMLTDSRLIIGLGPDPDVDGLLAPAAKALQLEAIHTLKHMASFSINKEGYEKLSDRLFSCVNEYNVGGATVFAFGKSFLANRFKHLTSIGHHYLLESLNEAFAGVPAILVAGGPSLDKNIELLPLVKGKAVIIAVDTVLPTLLNHGVSPDFVTSIDPEEFTYEKFAHVVPLISDASLICTSWVTPKVPKNFPTGRVFWSFAANSVESWLNSQLGGSMLTAGAKTVAHLNFISAVVMGCSPIIFVGQDLAFSNDKDHADDTVLSNSNMLEELLKTEKDLIWADGYGGGKVPTNRGFYSMIRSFESLIKNQKGPFINATEGGARIKGTDELSLREAIDKYCEKNSDVSKRLGKIYEKMPHPDTGVLINEFKNVLKEIKSVKKRIKKSDALGDHALKKLLQIKKTGAKIFSFSHLNPQIQKMMTEIDICHQKIDSSMKIWRVLQEITLKGLRQSERMKHEIEQLKDDPDQYVNWLLTNLKRLASINKVRSDVLKDFEQHLKLVIDHHESENDLLSLEESGENLLKLAELYFNSGNMVLAKTILDKLIKQIPGSADVKFLLGCLSAHRTEYAESDKYFKEAVSLDPSIEDSVEKFRFGMGGRYLSYIERLKPDGYDTRKILMKGLRYCPTHPGLKQELAVLAESELSIIKNSCEEGRILNEERILNIWHQDFKENTNLSYALSPAIASGFYQYHGHLMVSMGNLAEAEISFRRALEFLPDDPNIYIHLTNILFQLSEFEKGIACLDKAVTIDRNYAEYWENIGDNLLASDQPVDAAAAYERCYIYLPERCELLKKIGDCYQIADIPEAAVEAYKQFKSKIQLINKRECIC